MTGINILIKLSIVVFVIVTSAIRPCSSGLSDRRLCFDPKCSVPVSVARTMIDYYSNDPAIMSFKKDMDIQVYSKSAGKRQDLWGVEINGKRGYVPKNIIREKKVFKRTLLHDVPTEQTITNNETTAKTNDVPKKIDKVDEKVNDVPSKLIPEPNQISPSFEIHDGTTIPVNVDQEPHEPSYSTSTHQSNVEVEQHPILSVHPNIASSVTLKNQNNEIITEDESIDAEKYMKLAGLNEETGKNEKNDEASKESGEFVSLDKNYINETKFGDKSSDDQDKLNQDKISKSDELSLESVVPSDQENSPEIAKIDEVKSNTEESVKPNDVANSIIKNNEKDDDLANNANIDDQLVEKTKTTGTSLEQIQKQAKKTETLEERKDEKTSDVPVEHKEEITTEIPVELKEEITTEIFVTQQPEETKTAEIPMEKDLKEKLDIESPEITKLHETAVLPENNVNIEKINTNEVDSVPKDEKILKDSTIVTEDKEKVENRVNATENTAEIADVPESLQINVETMKKDIEESENIISTENSLPVDEKDSDDKNIEDKSNEDPSLNLNIINSFFKHLSMLPAMVGDGNTILSNSEAETAIDQDSNVKESDEKNSNVNESDEKNSNEENDINETNNEFEKLIDKTDKLDANDPVEAEISLKPYTTKPEIIEHSDNEKIVNIDVNNNNLVNDGYKNVSTDDTIERSPDFVTENPVQPGIYKEDELSGFGQEKLTVDETSSFNGFPANRNLLNVGSGLQLDDHKSTVDSSKILETEKSSESNEKIENEEVDESLNKDIPEIDMTEDNNLDTEQETADSCLVDSTCQKPEGLDENHSFVREMEDEPVKEEIDIIDVISIGRNYWETLTYLVVTAFTTLIFSLGYYYIENTRRDGQYIAKINQLEKQLLVCSKECTVLDETLKSTKSKLDSIEDESFGSNEMVASLKADLEASKTAKSELEDQVGMLEKELESATEAGLELERMLREILSTNNEDNPLARSVEDLQTRLNAQQAANEALTNALNLKAQENETLTAELKAMTLKSEQLEVEVTRVTEELKHQNNLKSNLEHNLLQKVEHLEKQIKDITAERINLRKQLKGKEMEMKDLLEVVNQMNISNLDFEKLYNVSRVKAEASQLLEERDDLKIKLSEVEGAHQLLEEHVKLINEEVTSLSEQCKLAEKAKRDAETRVEVLSNFFKEKEAQRQKEEAVWLQKQGEVSSTVERLHAMQNEIHSYKQQIEMLKREILDQEREYKNQIASIETKSHENWVIARQNERRLEESKAEAGQLRNRLTLIEKNLNETDPEAKLHRSGTNGETATSPQLFIGAEASSSPIMFTGSSGVPLPPPPSYLYGPPVPPFIPPPPHSSSGISSYEVGQRPPPLGGRLSSPPPLHSTNSGRYDDPRSPPPPLSPSMIPPFGPPHRAYPPPLFPNERIHPPPPSHSTHLPTPLVPASSHNWGNETIPPPPLRNTGFQPHQQQTQYHHHHHHHRDNQQRARNHKGSLHSSGESLDKNL